VSVRAGGYSAASDLVVQPDRKVVLAGIAGDGTWNSNFDFLAVRLNRNGSRDRSFGDGGIVRMSVDLGGMRRAELSAVARGPEGVIVLAGNAYRTEGGTDFAVVRLTPSGVLDTSFSDDGVRTIDLGPNDALSGVAVQPDGKLVLVGSGYGAWPAHSGFLVIRLLPNGALDTSFGLGGVVDTKIGDPSDGDAAADVAVLDDGRMVVAGTVDVGRQWTYSDPGTDFGVVRYLPDGRRDSTFGEDGFARAAGPSAERARDLVVAPDGRIVVVGTEGWPSQPRWPSRSRFFLARYLPTGALDPTFAAGGTLTTEITSGQWAHSGAGSVAVGGDGKIIAGGTTGTYYPAKAWSALARYNEDGSLDHTFGVGGKRRYPPVGSAIGIQPLAARSGADRLVMAGGVRSFDETRVAAIGVDLGRPRPPVRCRVPRVVGLSLIRARARIRSAQCRVGRVRRARSARPRGRVISQSPRAGRSLPRGSRVGLVVSSGR
jgi:uncharacterized delta-60 repeat protein